MLCLVEWALLATGNPNYIPSVIVLGAFLVPVTFVSYLYERLPSWDVPLRPVVICFVWGGVLGVVVAGILEYDVARRLGVLPTLGIGLIVVAPRASRRTKLHDPPGTVVCHGQNVPFSPESNGLRTPGERALSWGLLKSAL